MDFEGAGSWGWGAAGAVVTEQPVVAASSFDFAASGQIATPVVVRFSGTFAPTRAPAYTSRFTPWMPR